MAGAFDAKVDISTKEATDGLRALRKEVKDLGPALIELDKIIKNGKQNIVLIAQQFTNLVATQERAARAANDVAKADINAARAAGIRSVADAKVGTEVSRKATLDAQAARATAQAGTATARTTDITNRGAIATERHATSTRRAAASQLELHDSMSNSRYLMYDVGATYGVIAAGLMAIPAATAAVAAAYQKDFAQVIRVTEDLDKLPGGAQGLKDSLKTMATDMPIAFDELSRITQLGAQMGVANEKLSQFTETTAKFVAVTGISADSGSQLFGRLETSFTDDVAKFPDFFERVGSSIAYVGAKTVATDPEIAAMLNQIGSLGASAGFTAAQTTGLAAALASVRVQPELARGTLTRIFGQLNRDVAEGSPRLAEYGKVMGVTADEAGKLWKSNPSDFFTSLIKGLNKTHTSGGELTTTFDLLGIKASRDVSALTKLAVGYDVLDKSMQAADKGFSEGTALNEMSKITFDTVISKLIEMANAWKNLGDTMGAGALAPLGVLVDMAKNLAIGLSQLATNVPAVGVLLNLLMGFATITALFLGFKAAQSFVMAGFIGFQQAAGRGVGASLTLAGTMRQLAVTMLMAKGATQAQATAMVQQLGAMTALTRGTQLLTVSSQTAAVNGFGAMRAGAAKMASSLLGLVGGPIGLVIGTLALLAGHLISTQVEAQQAGKAIAEAMQQGADTGARAVAEAFNNRKVNATDGALGFSDIDKTVTQIAERSGVAFDKIVGSISKGEKGMADFRAELEKVAKEDGYKNLEDALSNPLPGTKAADLQFLSKVVEDYAKKSGEQAKGLKAVEAAAPGAGKALLDTGADGEEGAVGIDKMKDALKALNDEVFGTINAEADLQASLAKLGEGLYKASDFSPNSEGGRDNLKNIEDTMTKAREYYAQMKADGTLNAQEAAQGYADFINGLFEQLRATGADTTYVEDLANSTREKFAAAIGGNKPLMMTVEADPAAGVVSAQATRNVVQEWFNANEAKIKLGADSSETDLKLSDLANSIMEITGYPYAVVMDALTDPASDKAKEVEALLISITTGTYVAPVDADTSAAITNVQNFVAYARTELSHLQAELNGGIGYGDGEGSMSPAQKAQYGAINAPTRVATAPRQVRAPAPTKQNSLLPGLGGVADGYNKAGDAARKAGDKGKKAGEDMADGIDEAVKAAEDFGNRLKTALMSAYNQQYGLTKATDDYHSALNSINKKREDELKQLDDLRDKVKALNNERDKELISANKAKIEQNISLKYGETDRAADYGQKAQESLDNAAAKQKEIDANAKETKTLADGIGQLNGYSDAAIANREALRGLEAKMIDMVAAYAAAGHSSEEVRLYAQKLTGQFQVDVAQMGYNQTAVGNLQGSLERYIGVINGVPQVKPTTVTADVGGATAAVGGFGAAADWATRDRQQHIYTTFHGSLEATGNTTANNQPTYRVVGADGVRTNNILFNKGGQVPGFADGGMVPGRSPSDPSEDNLMAKVDGKGLIGIRSREFIQPEPAVDYYGLDAMEAIRTLRMPKFNMGGSPGGGRGSAGGAGGVQVVELTAENLALLASLANQTPILAVDGRELAQAVNRSNKQLVAEGQN